MDGKIITLPSGIYAGINNEVVQLITTNGELEMVAVYPKLINSYAEEINVQRTEDDSKRFVSIPDECDFVVIHGEHTGSVHNELCEFFVKLAAVDGATGHFRTLYMHTDYATSVSVTWKDADGSKGVQFGSGGARNNSYTGYPNIEVYRYEKM